MDLNTTPASTSCDGVAAGATRELARRGNYDLEACTQDRLYSRSRTRGFTVTSTANANMGHDARSAPAGWLQERHQRARESSASWTTVQYHCPPCPWIAENITEIDVLSFRVVRSHQAEEAALMVGWSKRSVGGSSIFRRLAENGAGYGYGHAWCISGIPITASSSFFWALDPP